MCGSIVMRIPAYFHPSYAPAEVPLLARLATTHQRLERLGLIATRTAKPLSPTQLKGLHDQAYLDAFIEGREPMASKQGIPWQPNIDRKSTRLNSSHVAISYAVFCLKKKTK